NKPDVGAEIARRWFDTEGVDMIIDVPNSAVALAVADIARDKNKVFIGSGAGTAPDPIKTLFLSRAISATARATAEFGTSMIMSTPSVSNQRRAISAPTSGL